MGRGAAARNLTKCWLAVALPTAGLGWLGYASGGLSTAITSASCVIFIAAGLYAFGDRAVLGMVGARELLETEAPQPRSTLATLAGRAGVAVPKLYLLPDGYPRVLVVGRGGQGGATVAVSTGLLTAANPSELEGLLAHEIALIRNRDVMVQTAAALLSSAIVELSRIGGAARTLFLAILGPGAASLTHLLLSPKRTFAADRAAARLCDSPHGLADALLRLEAAQGMVAFAASPATESLYAVSPFAPDRLSAMFATHPPTAERIARLRALDPEWRDRLHEALQASSD